mmetsp:Transcript_24966/g.57690  ORF Transcript_24966/g.57690 Transcript_24966/m.57690 type:complete len:210 (+) Transcript_24966:672-1301(+)
MEMKKFGNAVGACYHCCFFISSLAISYLSEATAAIANGFNGVTYDPSQTTFSSHRYLKSRDSFQKLIDALVKELNSTNGVVHDDVWLHFDGEKLLTTDTPTMKGMENNDLIDVTIRGYDPAVCKTVTSAPVLSKKIKLQLRTVSSSSCVPYWLGPKEPFLKLLEKYCNEKSKPLHCVQFQLDGMNLNLKSTCEEEDLEGDEIIDVILKK